MRNFYLRFQKTLSVYIVFFIVLGFFSGCDYRRNGAESAPDDQYKLLLPAKIDILPFTKPRSWDDDQIPDGIEVVLRPLDSFGDQTKAIGTFRFELYTYAKATAEPKGKRIGFWEEDLTTRSCQYQHWDKITRTYRFRLAWVGQRITTGKYILEVTYQSPSGLRLSDSYIMEARIPKEQFKEKKENQQKSPFQAF